MRGWERKDKKNRKQSRENCTDREKWSKSTYTANGNRIESSWIRVIYTQWKHSLTFIHRTHIHIYFEQWCIFADIYSRVFEYTLRKPNDSLDQFNLLQICVQFLLFLSFPPFLQRWFVLAVVSHLPMLYIVVVIRRFFSDSVSACNSLDFPLCKWHMKYCT